MRVPTQAGSRTTAGQAWLGRPQALAVWAVWAVALGLALLALVEAWLGGPADPGSSVEILLGVLSSMTVGAVLVTRLPRNLVGWLLLASGLLIATSVGAGALADYGLIVHPRSVPGAIWLAWLDASLGTLTLVVPAVFLPLVFPTGHLPSRNWRPVAVVGVAATTCGVIADVFGSGGNYQPGVVNPLLLGGPAGDLVALLGSVGNALAGPGVLLVLASLVVRYRRAAGIERAQLRWFAAVVVVVVLALMVAILAGGSTSPMVETINSAAWLILIGGFALLPLAIGIAVLRYRLYEIDRLISRSIGWGVLTVVLGAVFVGLVLGLQAILAPLTRSNELAVAGSTLLVFSLFQPLRSRVQGLVDRRFNRARYDARQALDAFSARLRDEVDLDTLQESLLTLVEATLEPTTVSLWLRE